MTRRDRTGAMHQLCCTMEILRKINIDKKATIVFRVEELVTHAQSLRERAK